MTGDAAIIRNIFARSQIAGRDGSMALTGGVGDSISPWDGVVRSSPHFGTHYLPGGLALPVFGAWDQITNSVIQSQAFSGADWLREADGVASVPTVTDNYALSPIGDMTAARIRYALNGGSTGGDWSRLRSTLLYPVISSSTYGLSFWARTNDASTKVIQISDEFANLAQDNLSITPTWKRFILPGTAAGTFAKFRIWLRGAAGTSDSADILLWGMQFEAIPSLTAGAALYVPTTAAAVTRTADSCAWTMPNALTQDEELTMLNWQPYADGDMGIANQTWIKAFAGGLYPGATRAAATLLSVSEYDGVSAYVKLITRTLPSRATLCLQSLRRLNRTIDAGYGSALSGVPVSGGAIDFQAASGLNIGHSTVASRAGRGFGGLIRTPGGLAQYERDALARYLHLVLRPAAA